MIYANAPGTSTVQLKIPADLDAEFRALRAQTECKHADADTELRRKANKNRTIAIARQCLVCGAIVGNTIKQNTMTKAEIQALPEWDFELKDQFARDRSIRSREIKQRIEAAVRDEWNRQDAAYRRTPEWKKKRRLIEETRSHGICEGCAERPATQLHHLTYLHWRNEFLFELAHLCDVCHKRLHDTQPPIVLVYTPS